MRVNKKLTGRINSVCVNLLLTFLLVTPANATNEYSFTSIDFPGAGIDVRGINNAGQIVGSVDHSDFSSDGFVLSGGSFTTFSFPGAFGTKAVGINDAGQIVGYYGGCCGAAQHGFLLSRAALALLIFPVPPPATLSPTGSTIRAKS